MEQLARQNMLTHCVCVRERERERRSNKKLCKETDKRSKSLLFVKILNLIRWLLHFVLKNTINFIYNPQLWNKLLDWAAGYLLVGPRMGCFMIWNRISLIFTLLAKSCFCWNVICIHQIINLVGIKATQPSEKSDLSFHQKLKIGCVTESFN